ncbi:MAG TPA: amino acid racemase [Chroococcales cyanobacterium]
MALHIGIVACSAEGAALCYRTICAESPVVMGAHAHPEITMHTHPLSEYMQFIYLDHWQAVADLMLSSAQIVAQAGASFAICPDNTIHQALALIADRSPIPWLHIAQEVVKVASTKGYKKLGVTGTRYLMEGPVYREALASAGIEHEVPNEEDRIKINKIIMDELVYGKFTEPSRQYFGGVVDKLKRTGCDAVVLACTEIPLLVTQKDSTLPVLDSTRILARAAIARATEDVPTSQARM